METSITDEMPTLELSRSDIKAPNPGILLKIEKHFSKPGYRKALDASTIGFFLFLIIGPLFSIIFSVIFNWNSIFTSVFNDPITGNLQAQIMATALGRSFEIATMATCIDLLLGMPMAFILTRYNFKGRKILDTLVDLPMAVPTSALGFSLYLFWGTNMGLSGLLGLQTGFISPGPLLITFTHVAFTYPFIVRNLKVIFQETTKTYEDAAKTLGAPGFTVFRTVTIPLAKEGILAGTILAFTRSLGETGATIIVAGVFETAPMYVVSLKQSLHFPAAAFLSMILISISLLVLVFLRMFARRVGFPVSKVWPRIERKLSTKPARISRNALGLTLFIVIVLVPALYTIPYVFEFFSINPFTHNSSNTVLASLFAPDNKWAWLWVSTINSLEIASLATLICVLFGLPMAMILVKRHWRRVMGLLDALVDLPLVAPTAALGFAMYLFWGPMGLNVFQPGFWLIVLVHVAMCFPYVVRPIVAIIQKTDPELEDAARTLGASSLTTFRTITLPRMQPGIVAGMIMSFTRSMGETGATMVVSGLITTVPILIVQWFETSSFAAAGFASLLLILFSFIVLLLLRKTMEHS